MYHPIFQARIPCTILNSKLGYRVPSQGMYWYILWSKFGTVIHDSGALPACLSSFQPRSQIWALTCPLSQNSSYPLVLQWRPGSASIISYVNFFK